MAASRSSLSGAEPASRRSLIARTIGSCKFTFLAIAGVKVNIGLSGEAFASNISLPLVTGGKGQRFEPAAEATAPGSKRNRFSADARRYVEAIAAMGMAGALRDRWEANNVSFLLAQSKAADRTSLFSTTIKTLRFILQSAAGRGRMAGGSAGNHARRENRHGAGRLVFAARRGRAGRHRSVRIGQDDAGARRGGRLALSERQDGRQRDFGPKKQVLERLTAGNPGDLKAARQG